MIFAQLLTLLADVAKEAGDQAQQPPANPFGGGFLPMMLLIAVLFYFLMIRPQQKRQEAERQAINTGLKKNAKVITAGGILGVVAREVGEKDEEVVIRVDDSQNVRIRVLRSSIIRVTQGDGEAPREST